MYYLEVKRVNESILRVVHSACTHTSLLPCTTTLMVMYFAHSGTRRSKVWRWRKKAREKFPFLLEWVYVCTQKIISISDQQAPSSFLLYRWLLTIFLLCINSERRRGKWTERCITWYATHFDNCDNNEPRYFPWNTTLYKKICKAHWNIERF